MMKEEQDMEIKYLIRLLQRNVLYLILGLVLGAGIGVIVTKTQTPVYEAATKVFVSRARQQGTSDLLAMSDEQLLAINLQLAKSQPVLNDVSSQLGIKIDAENIQVSAIPNSLIIQVKVRDSDPQRAAIITNLIVRSLDQQNETLLSGRYTGFENAISEQIEQVQKQIVELQTRIDQINNSSIQEQLAQVNQQIDQTKAEMFALNQDISNFPLYPNALQLASRAEKQAQLDQLLSLMTLYQEIQSNLTYIGKPAQNGSGLENPQLATLQSTLNLYKQINNSLVTSREGVRSAAMQSGQNIMQIVIATPATKPVLPIPVIYILFGSLVGFILAVVFILVIDHMDESLKSAAQVEELLGLPVLGFVYANKYKSGLVTSCEPYSTAAEMFRALGASLEITETGKNIRTLMIVNAEPKDARTDIAANLAVINAQQGKQVILMDGDLRHPYLHSLFSMENQRGFSELLNGRVDIKSACHVVNDVEGLTLISSGIAEKKSVASLDTEKWEQLLSGLQKQADLVIVDSPPADVADAQILASKMNAVLLAIRSEHTHIDSAQTTLRIFKLVGARVAGVVLMDRTMHYREINKQFFTWLKTKLRKKKKPGEVDVEREPSTISLS
jgi:capsular exopolysaccharide synthesis family protein